MIKNIKNLRTARIFSVFIFQFLFFLLILVPLFTSADQTACNPSTELCNPTKFESIPALFEAVLKIAAEIGSVIIILALIYSGFLFVMARGNEEELTKAKRAITYTVIGAVLVLGAWAFSVAISNTIHTITTPAT